MGNFSQSAKNRKLTIFYKIHNKLCPPYLFYCLPPVTSDVNNYNLRNNQNYVPPRYRLRTSASSFIPTTVSLWNNLDISIRNSPTLSSFKNRVKGDIYKPPKYYNEGPRKLSILHTRLRHQCSSLNAELSRIHIINNSKCNCGASLKMLYIIFWNVIYTWTKEEHFLVIATISTSILKLYSLGTMIIVMTSTPKYL
jgi:hypothetical protein